MTLDIRRGTIHGLVGENGAGKSTLMHILYGMIPPDSGTIRLDGSPVVFRSPRDALARGIGMVHQHFMLVPELSVLENIILGMEPVRRGLIDRRRAVERLLERAPHAADELDLERPARDLSLGDQQRVEILKLLYRDARILILDEPTAVLPPIEVKRLFAEIRRLAGQDRTVILITHKLLEVMEATDSVSVLRQGRLRSTRPTAEASLPLLAREIVGARDPADAAAAPHGAAGPVAAPIGTADAVHAPIGAAGRALDSDDLSDEVEGRNLARHPRRQRPAGAAPFVRLENVVALGAEGRGGLRGLSLSVYPGEILAVAAVEGNGASELARLLAGRLAPLGGVIVLGGRALPPGRPLPQAPAVVGYIPEDRHRDALVLSMSLARNLILGRQREPRFRRGVFLDDAALGRHARTLIEAHDIRPPDPARPAGLLSGGNQQKAVVAREVEEHPPLLVAAHPTRGLDLKASRAVHDLLRGRRDEGAAVVLVTAELDEARLLGDSMVVLFEGKVAGEVDPVTATDEEIGLLMTGGKRP